MSSSRAIMARRRRAARAYQVRSYRSAASTRMALRSARILNVLPRRTSSEVKSVDTTAASGSGVVLTLNSTPLVTPINLIQEGSGFYNRIGRRIEMQSLHLTGQITCRNVQSNQDYCRILVVYDRQTNGILPSAAAILADYDQQGAVSTGVYSGVNPDYRERFLILADIRLTMPGTSNASPGTSVTNGVDPLVTTFNINRFIRLRNLATQYQSTHNPSIIDDISTGALYVMTMGTQAAAAAPWQYNAKWRLRYRDT